MELEGLNSPQNEADDYVDFNQAIVGQDPYRAFAEWRGRGPVIPARDFDGTPLQVVIAYEYVQKLLSDPRLSKSPVRACEIGVASPPEGAGKGIVGGYILKGGSTIIRHNLVNSDEPVHGRLKGLIEGHFTPARIEALRGRLEELTANLLTSIDPKVENDLVETLFAPVVVSLICEVLGLPHETGAWLRNQGKFFLTPSFDAKGSEVRQQGIIAFRTYLSSIIEHRRQELKDNPASGQRNDVLTDLLKQPETAISEDEILRMMELLFVAGHDTTIGLLSSGLMHLLQRPEQLAALVEKPSLTKQAIEEMLRYDSPVTRGLFRVATEDVPVGDAVIPAGSFVILLIGVTNRDSDRFPSADVFDISRKRQPHLAFGGGPHFCMGAGLARFEADVIFGILLKEYPQMVLGGTADDIRWHWPSITRNLVKLIVTLQPD